MKRQTNKPEHLFQDMIQFGCSWDPYQSPADDWQITVSVKDGGRRGGYPKVNDFTLTLGDLRGLFLAKKISEYNIRQLRLCGVPEKYLSNYH